MPTGECCDSLPWVTFLYVVRPCATRPCMLYPHLLWGPLLSSDTLCKNPYTANSATAAMWPRTSALLPPPLCFCFLLRLSPACDATAASSAVLMAAHMHTTRSFLGILLNCDSRWPTALVSACQGQLSASKPLLTREEPSALQRSDGVVVASQRVRFEPACQELSGLAGDTALCCQVSRKPGA